MNDFVVVQEKENYYIDYLGTNDGQTIGSVRIFNTKDKESSEFLCAWFNKINRVNDQLSDIIKDKIRDEMYEGEDPECKKYHKIRTELLEDVLQWIQEIIQKMEL